MSTSTLTPDDADQALKAKHRAMWALGDYHAVATEIIADLGPVLVEATGIAAGQHVLDVAAGAGNVAIPAAATGAHVIASDLTPELLEQGRRRRADRGADARLARRRRRAPAVRRRRLRRGHLVRRRHVRAAPPAGRRRAGPGVPSRRDDRPDQLDARRASSGRCSRP